MCHKPWCRALCSPLRTHPSQDREAQSLQRIFCAQQMSNRSSPASCMKTKPTEMHNYWHVPIFNGLSANFYKAPVGFRCFLPPVIPEILWQWVSSVPLKTFFYHCDGTVHNSSSFHCVETAVDCRDCRKSCPRIKLLKNFPVLALSQTPWCVYGQGHKFFGFPFPISEGNLIMAFPLLLSSSMSSNRVDFRTDTSF